MDICLPYAPELIAGSLAASERRIMLYGPSGTGKTTLAAGLARAFARAGRACQCIGADPGSPSFGAPGAVCLGRWENDDWQLTELAALCTLDAGRFRLPLVLEVQRLAESVRSTLLVDAPGIIRNVAGAELLNGLVRAAGIDTLLVLLREGQMLPVAGELAVLGCEVLLVQPSADAREPRKRRRARQRTGLWEKYLDGAGELTIFMDGTTVTGTAPPLDAHQDWTGRQIALLRQERTLAMGEILAAGKDCFRVRIAEPRESPDHILVRDARRDSQGLMATFKPAGDRGPLIMPPDMGFRPEPVKGAGPAPLVRLGQAAALLVNGIFGDPLLHLRFQNSKRSMLFDLGEGGRLPARLAHQVTDVFISHAHIDHISGFLWLMRSRIGMPETCRLFGPPGLSDRIASLINGIHWDRIGDEGPCFEVYELHGEQLGVYRLQAGREEKEQLPHRSAGGGLLLEDRDCRIRAVQLTHGAIPVLAYSLELSPTYTVRKNRLTARGLSAGPWLGELKNLIAAGDRQAEILLPDGSKDHAGRLADDLIQVTPARKLVYATDLSDTGTNRDKLAGLAREADIFFCEAAFLEADSEYARLSGHLTTLGCAEIADAAGVGLLVPFHFSRRYEKMPDRVFTEVKKACRRAKVRLPDRER